MMKKTNFQLLQHHVVVVAAGCWRWCWLVPLLLLHFFWIVPRPAAAGSFLRPGYHRSTSRSSADYHHHQDALFFDMERCRQHHSYLPPLLFLEPWRVRGTTSLMLLRLAATTTTTTTSSPQAQAGGAQSSSSSFSAAVAATTPPSQNNHTNTTTTTTASSSISRTGGQSNTLRQQQGAGAATGNDVVNDHNNNNHTTSNPLEEEDLPLPPWKCLLEVVLSSSSSSSSTATNDTAAAKDAAATIATSSFPPPPPYRDCLEACYEAVEAAAAIQVLDAMEQANIVPSPHECGLAVRTVCRAAALPNRDDAAVRKELLPFALNLVTHRSDLPLAAYDAVLSALGRDWTSAVRLLRAMEDRTKIPSMPGSTAHDPDTSAIELAPPTAPALSTYRLVVEACVAAGQVEPACQVLRSCLERNISPTSHVYELVIAALSRKQQWRRALQLLDQMEGSRGWGNTTVVPTLACYNAILAALAKAREPVPALQLLARLRRHPNLQPDIYSYNSALAAAAGSPRHWSDALKVLDQCQRHPGVTPDIYSYTNAIRACAKGGQTRRALTLLQVAKDRRLPVDAYCYAAALEACAKARLWHRALQLLNEMQVERHLQPTEVTYSVCITACGNAGQWEEALRLLDEMRDRGLEANIVTYNAAITALARAAKHPRAAAIASDADADATAAPMWPRVRGLLAQMRERGLEPDGFTYSSAISCCGAEGRWQEALRLLEEMQSNGPRTRPNKIAYSAAITCCGRAGQVDQALRLFQQMREQGISADRVSYNAVFAALRVSQRGDAAYDLWRELIGRGSKNATDNRSLSSPRTIVAVDQASPDIITVTEVIAAVSADETAAARDRVDQVFAEAVNRGILLRSNLDSSWDFDLSGMTLPVARAACRFLLRRIAHSFRPGHQTDVQDLTFITGVGINHLKRHPVETSKPSDGNSNRDVSLRAFVQEVLLQDFEPPLTSTIPSRAQGTVQVGKVDIRAWLAKQL